MDELIQLSHFVADTQFDDLPDDVVERAKWVLRDTVGVIIAGMSEPEVNALAGYAAAKSPGNASLFGHAGRVKPEWAALVHGTAGTSLEMDEGHAFARGHASVHAVSPALALAETRGASGKELLTALILGYEVAARAGVATRLRKGVHPFGVWGVLGAASIGARFNGLNGEDIAKTLEVAASYAITPSFETAYQGANVRNTYAGMVNYLGLLAADFYGLGFRGERGGLQTAFGQILGDEFDPNMLVDGLGERYEIMRGYFKPHSACRYAHAAVDAVLELTAHKKLKPDEIRSVEVATYDIAATLKETHPTTPLAGRFSIPHTVAATLVLGNANPEAFTLDALNNPDIQALASKVILTENPDFTAMAPAKRPASVTIIFNSGEEKQHTVYGSKGDPDQPMSPDELETKFQQLTSSTLGNDLANQAWQFLGNIEQLSDLSDLGKTLSPQLNDPVQGGTM
ncbi:MAG: MmgE/PrpD family protein [Chloroflexi bacterium]|nr:MmgE/PrpD family protein [Chloroflexota bacterium]